MGFSTGHNGLYTGRRGLYAGPKYKADSFSPSRLPGLLAWYDPSLGEGTGFTVDAGKVQRIDDLSGNGYHLTNATVSERPVVGATINGLTTIGFNIAASVNESMESTTLPLGASQCFAFVAERKDDDVAGGDRKPIGNGAYTSSVVGFRVLFEDNFSGTYRRAVFEVSDGAGNHSLRTAKDTVRTGTPVVVLAQYDGSNLVLRVNGTETTMPSTKNPSKTGNFAYGNERIGNRQYEFVGLCGELVVCDALDLEDRASLVGYLMAKWIP